MLIRMRRHCGPSILISFAFLLSSCSTVELGDVGKLAQAGQTTFANLSSYYSDTAANMPTVLEIEVLRSALQPGISPPSNDMIKSITRIETSLRQRAQLAGELATLYDSLYELAATDYAGGFTTASKDFYGSIGAFATAIGETSPITEAQTQLLDGLAGRLITEGQKRRTEKANLIVLQQLELLAPLLARDQAAVTAARRATATQVEEGGIALWRAGLASAKPLLTRYGGVAGLEMVEAENNFTVANPKLADAVPALIRFRLRQIDAAEANRYDVLERLVADLIRRHRAIASGAPIDVAALLAHAADLRKLRTQTEAAFAH